MDDKVAQRIRTLLHRIKSEVTGHDELKTEANELMLILAIQGETEEEKVTTFHEHPLTELANLKAELKGLRSHKRKHVTASGWQTIRNQIIALEKRIADMMEVR